MQAALEENQVHIENGQRFVIRYCKYADACPRFDGANATIPTVISYGFGAGRRSKVVDRLNPCVHGGGIVCPGFKGHTKKEQEWFQAFTNRSKPVTVTAQERAKV